MKLLEKSIKSHKPDLDKSVLRTPKSQPTKKNNNTKLDLIISRKFYVFRILLRRLQERARITHKLGKYI